MSAPLYRRGVRLDVGFAWQGYQADDSKGMMLSTMRCQLLLLTHNFVMSLMILIYMLPGLFAPIGMISPTLLRRSRGRLDGQQCCRSTPGQQQSLLCRFIDLLHNIPLMSSAPPKSQPDPKPDPPPRPPPSGPKPFPGDAAKST